MLQAGRKAKKNVKHLPKSFHVKTGDTVVVISGKDKGKTGTVRQVFKDRGMVLVEGVNKVKKALRPNPMAGVQGGLTEMEAPLYVSKVMLFDIQVDKATRVKHVTLADGRKTRASKRSDHQFDA